MKHLKRKVIATIVVIITIGISSITANNITSKQNISNSDIIIKNLEGKRVLVLFFSRAGDNYKVGYVKKGNTKFLAEYIADMTNADTFEITAKKNYDIPYEKMLGLIREEFENGESPEFNGEIKNISQYDVIFVGGPIWWGTYPRVMFSFFKKYDLNGKILIPFTTSQGSGLGNTKVDLQEMYPDATVLNGFTMAGNEAREAEARQTVEQWLTQLEYKKTNTIGEVHKLDNAKKVKKPLTLKGKEYDNQKKMVLEVTFQDGHQENLELVVQGAIDMGIGTLWGAVNLNAEAIWETGGYYAWGETEPKESYTEDNYAYYHRTIGRDIDETRYDAVHTRLGGDWRMPTKGEWNKLLNSTQQEWVTIQGKQGYLFIAKNGSRLFFPTNGYIYDQEVGTPDEGYYWTSTFSNIDNAYVSYFLSSSLGISNFSRYTGMGIRPVK